MGRKQDITEYYLGETIGIDAFLCDREGNYMDLTNVTVTFVVGDEASDTVHAKISSDIVKSGTETGKVLIPITVEQQRSMEHSVNYTYDLWTNDGNETLHQATGRFRLNQNFKA